MADERELSGFTEKEVRWDYYPMFQKLMDKGCEIEAFMFILSTWNFARFRYVMRDFDLDAFTDTIKKLNHSFQKIQHEDFKTINLNKYADDIKHIFKSLADFKGIEATGAPKLMHLKLPKVFVMWDSYIRKAYGYKKGNAEDYIAFLKDMQKSVCYPILFKVILVEYIIEATFYLHDFFRLARAFFSSGIVNFV